MLGYHLGRLLGPAEMLGPIDCERCKPSSIYSNFSFCSSTFFLNLACKQTGCIRTLSALKIGNQVLPEDSVQTDCMLPGHQDVYNLLH